MSKAGLSEVSTRVERTLDVGNSLVKITHHAERAGMVRLSQREIPPVETALPPFTPQQVAVDAKRVHQTVSGELSDTSDNVGEAGSLGA